ncbi:glycosyl hydrolase 53 family protein [Costertonia aggregata]|uniref:Arabinogalactan endo-beta-1,4-galactanase n=1 Tax=Costertonia aggregata TaxID=343403 RepID=A0A7H9ANP7_9FLAO|nr:glycosyl hydrolase 53 family protein [Costertonia aggregata]QLG45079.1 glycosyl hydrolase 53 family protein [Costertonia aggregata]
MKKKSKFLKFAIVLAVMILASCDDVDEYIAENLPNTDSSEEESGIPIGVGDFEVRAMDVSFLPQLDRDGVMFKNDENETKDLLEIIKASGVNTVRLRLWAKNTNIYGYDEVKILSDRAKALGLKTWITIHYSDTWADLNNQKTPDDWPTSNLDELKDIVNNYTKNIVLALDPDYVQVGNEINKGILLPLGDYDINWQNFRDLVGVGCQAVREASSKAKIIMHYAGIGEGANNFFLGLYDLDYDIIAVSYYPIYYEGKGLDYLKSSLNELNATYRRPNVQENGQPYDQQIPQKLELLIAEVAYPFTEDNDDQTNNIYPAANASLLSEFSATREGQAAFLRGFRQTLSEIDNTLGFGYWGGEFVAFDGIDALNGLNGSNYDNHALFFRDTGSRKSFKELPALQEFKE